MHVLYVHANFSTARGSWGTRAYDFARRWSELGHSVTVVTGVYDRSDLRPTRLLWTGVIDGITVHALNVPFSNRDGFTRRVITTLLLGTFAGWHAARRSCDVVLVSCGPIPLGAAGLVARWLRRRTVVVEVRDLFSDGLEQLRIVTHPAVLAGLRGCEAVCFRSAHAVVTLSDTMRQWVRRRHRLRHVAVVPNTADVELFEPGCALPSAMPGPAAKNFVYTGTLGRANDCGQLLRAARYLKSWSRSDIHIHLVGDGSERRALEAEASRAGLDRVHFVPPMPRETLARWLGAATAMILVLKPIPVFDTVSPNKLFDALAAGLPVLQTTRGWIRRLLAERDCGLTVDPGQPAGLAEAMVALSDDRPRRERMGRNARRVACELFSKERLADRMLDILTATHLEREGA